MEKVKKIDELRIWLKNASDKEVDMELLGISRELSSTYERYWLIRDEAINRENSKTDFKVKISGNLLQVTQEGMDFELVSDYLKSISYNTTYLYYADSDDDIDLDSAYDSEPQILIHNRFKRLKADILKLEGIDYVNNDIAFYFGVTTGPYVTLVIYYNRDTNLFHGHVEELIVRNKRSKLN